MSPAPKVACGRCGAEATGATCAACAGAVVKICPSCQTKNSLAKKFCDSCAADISLADSPARGDIPHTATRRVERAPQAEAGLNIPKAGRTEAAYAGEAAPAPVSRSTKPHVVPGGKILLPSGWPYFFKSVFALLFLATVVAGASLGVLRLRASRSPARVAPQVAARYLDSMAANDYASGYDMLSEGARAQYSIDDFRLLRDTAPWGWSNMAVTSAEPAAVVLHYDRTTARRVTRESLVLIKERGEWVYPNVDPLLRQTQAALHRADPDMAMIKSQEAARLNPRHAAARAYLCEAAYHLRFGARVVTECSTALLLAQRYSTPLPDEKVYQLHAMLADTHKSLRAFSKAVEHYDAMLATPGVSADDRCSVLLARCDARISDQRRLEAAEDLQAARERCSKPEDLELIRQLEQQLKQR